MPKGYHHLTYAQRSQILILKERGDSSNKIAKALNLNPSTISRELKRNTENNTYNHERAQVKATLKRTVHPNKKMNPRLIAIIEEKLKLQWSPVQISGWLKLKCKVSISHETIYKYIWKDKQKGGSLYKELRHQGKKYNKRSQGTAGGCRIIGRVGIEKRPPIVEEKIRLGDWELDTIIGAGKQEAIVSMVERSSKLTILVKVNHKTARNVKEALLEKLGPMKAFVHTLTSDNGTEFAYHQEVSRKLEAGFYFANPYHSWERGLNEHTNGLVRQYIPKKTYFESISNEDIRKVELLLNNRPRKVLDFESPIERFERLSKDMICSKRTRGYLNKSVYGFSALHG